MHWLEEQVQRLGALAQAVPDANRNGHFLDALRQVVEAVGKHDGVTACFACHDGLTFEVAGKTTDFDALSAMAQWSLLAAKETALTLSLGHLRQMVIIGDEHKLALFLLGPLAVGILSPAAVHLGRALAHPGAPHAHTEGGFDMNATLLSQLGGRDAIELVVALFYDRVLDDPELLPFFRGASMPRLQQLQTDFFCSALGGTPWKGRDLKTVHAGLHITDHHFNLVATHLQAVLGEVGVSPDHIRQVLALVGTLRSQIVSSAARTTSARAAP